MRTRSYVVKRIGVSALARWGFVAGALVACFPAFGCSAILFSLTSAVHRIVETWRDVGLTVFGQRLSLDLIQLLHLDGFAQVLGSINTLGVLGILLFALIVALAMGVVVALSFVLLGVFYNLTGRLELELAEK